MASGREITILSGWGRTLQAPANVIEVGSIADILQVLDTARTQGQTVVSRGSGYSYGDVALIGRNIVIDMRPMRRVISWNGSIGVIDLEPGVTVRELCRHVAPSGFWPPVIPGASEPTIGGCIAVNAHGKNNWKAGTIGEHVQEMDVVFADGSLRTLSPTSDEKLFRSVIGGLGLLGIITRIRLRMERSADVLHVDQYAAPQLEDVLAILDRWHANADYMVGWLDGFATGDDLGRGLVQIAHSLPPDGPGENDLHTSGLAGKLSETVRPKLWMGLQPLARNSAIARLNQLQFVWGTINSGRGSFVPRWRFEFFHDFIPNWNRAFRGGIVQYQIFLPAEQATPVFRFVLQQSQEAGFPPFLAVLKRHRADQFLLSYGVDGYSLSLDFHAGRMRLVELIDVLRRLTDEIVLPAGGRFYPPKDSILTGRQIRQALGCEAVSKFLEIKREVDPHTLLQSDFYRRALVDSD